MLCCISIVGMAQTDVTNFLGIPVDGKKSDMMSKLKSKGFTQSPYAEGVLTGKFNGMDVNVHIATNNDKVCRIMVCDANTMDEASIRIRFNVLCEQFKNSSKYCSLSEKDPKLKEDENISYEMTVHKKFYVACKQSHVVRKFFIAVSQRLSIIPDLFSPWHRPNPIGFARAHLA